MGTFSKGMRQKVALAGALVRECPVIVLDEPTSGLDPLAAAELMDLLREQARRGCLVFLSTHDIFRVDRVADRVAILHGGRLARLFSREELGTGRLLEEYVSLISAVPGGKSPAPVTGGGAGASQS